MTAYAMGSIFDIISFISFKAVECTSEPKYEKAEVYADTFWDPDSDEAIFQAVAQHTCPEGYVFQIYQNPLNESVNFGLIEDETDVLNVTCSPTGQWAPVEVPPCIRKWFIADF